MGFTCLLPVDPAQPRWLGCQPNSFSFSDKQASSAFFTPENCHWSIVNDGISFLIACTVLDSSICRPMFIAADQISLFSNFFLNPQIMCRKRPSQASVFWLENRLQILKSLHPGAANAKRLISCLFWFVHLFRLFPVEILVQFTSEQILCFAELGSSQVGRWVIQRGLSVREIQSLEGGTSACAEIWRKFSAKRQRVGFCAKLSFPFYDSYSSMRKLLFSVRSKPDLCHENAGKLNHKFAKIWCFWQFPPKLWQSNKISTPLALCSTPFFGRAGFFFPKDTTRKETRLTYHFRVKHFSKVPGLFFFTIKISFWLFLDKWEQHGTFLQTFFSACKVVIQGVFLFLNWQSDTGREISKLSLWLWLAKEEDSCPSLLPSLLENHSVWLSPEQRQSGRISWLFFCPSQAECHKSLGIVFVCFKYMKVIWRFCFSWALCISTSNVSNCKIQCDCRLFPGEVRFQAVISSRIFHEDIKSQRTDWSTCISNHVFLSFRASIPQPASAVKLIINTESKLLGLSLAAA